jgi:membrane protease YdiL (CAAX protease family)
MSIPPPQAQAPESAAAPAQDQRAFDEPPWSPWTAPAAVVLGFALGVFSSLVVAIIASAGGTPLGHPTPAVSIIGDIMFDLSFVAAAFYLASTQGRPRPADFGFRRTPVRFAVKAFLAAGFGYYALTAVYATVFQLHGQDKLPSELGADTSTAAMIATGVFVCVIAPIAEEFFFRGFLFGGLRRWKLPPPAARPWVAAVITGILFGLAHTGSANAQYLVPLGFLGFVLCLVRWRTTSLYPCMALHATNNALALGVNQLHWQVGGIIALMIAANAVIAAATWPLADRGPAMHQRSVA